LVSNVVKSKWAVPIGAVSAMLVVVITPSHPATNVEIAEQTTSAAIIAAATTVEE
jgi:hypothetical protein